MKTIYKAIILWHLAKKLAKQREDLDGLSFYNLSKKTIKERKKLDKKTIRRLENIEISAVNEFNGLVGEICNLMTK